MTETALIVGAGPGLGAAVARRAARDGMRVAVSSRKTEKLESVAKSMGAKPYACDATDPQAIEALFSAVTRDLGVPNLVVYNAGAYAPGSVLETEPEVFLNAWKNSCYGGFLVGRAAAKAMLERGSGTILFTGATASLRGGARFVNLATGKFGLRAVSQSLARDVQPKGIHVAHIIVEGQIAADRPGYRPSERGEDAVLSADSIADTYMALHRQHRSAWTLELDVRPWVEKF